MKNLKQYYNEVYKAKFEDLPAFENAPKHLLESVKKGKISIALWELDKAKEKLKKTFKELIKDFLS